MSDPRHKREDCRLCRGKNLECVLQLAPSPLADSYVPSSSKDTEQQRYPLDLYLCNDCGFLQLLDVIHPEAIYVDYLYESKSSLGLAEHFNRYAEKIMDTIRPDKDSLVVDVGSNDGILLSAFKSRGLRVLGVEPAREIARLATANGVKTIADFFGMDLAREIREKYGPAMLITSNNLVANIDDLTDFSDGVRHLLAPEGVFVFESFYLLDLIDNMVFDFIYHEHLSYFSVAPLEKFFSSIGMELIDVERVPTKGGSLRYIVQLAGGPRQPTPAVAELKLYEEKRKLHRPEIFSHFSEKIKHARDRVVKLLRELKEDGKVIAGYGASATTTTMLYHFEIGSFLDYLVDDNPVKINLFSPALHLPVYPSQVLNERKPDYTYITAWRYADAIVARHKGYLDGGGRFIVPFPELKVIESAKV